MVDVLLDPYDDIAVDDAQAGPGLTGPPAPSNAAAREREGAQRVRGRVATMQDVRVGTPERRPPNPQGQSELIHA